MIVKLPASAVSYVGPKGGTRTERLAMSLGPAMIPGQYQGFALVEEEPDVWAIRERDGLEFFSVGGPGEYLTGECVTLPGVNDHVGYALPEAVNGRGLPRHVVMCEPDGRLQPYNSIEDVREKHPKIVVGHEWGSGAGNGYERCSRCRDERKCAHPTESRVAGFAGGQTCAACGTDLR